jgi:hypothetical protein
MNDRRRKPARGAKVDLALKAMFDGIAAQPVPQRFIDLIERLEADARPPAKLRAR